MKYIGEFRNNKNQLYTVEIITNNDSSITKNITLGGNPIITEVESDENMFKPVKYSSSTIDIVNNDILPDMYTSEAQGTKVTLYYGSVIKWTGYLTPNLYNQNFVTEVENIHLEAIDGLSSLQYIDFTSELKQFKSIKDIIVNILKKCNCYNILFLPLNLQIDKTKREYLIEQLYISEANFFENEGEAWKCDKVLEEICKYLGLTCISQGNLIYLLDYEGLVKGRETSYYINYNLDNSTIINDRPITLNHKLQISSNNIRSAKTQISLGDTYNKITVVDSLYSLEEVIPDLDDDKKLSNINGKNEYEYKDLKIDVDKLHYKTWYKFMTHPNFETYNYAAETMLPITGKPHTYDELSNIVGGNIIKLASTKIEKEEDIDKPISSLDWQTYIYINNLDKQQYNIDRLMLSTHLPEQFCINTNDAYIVIDFSCNFCTRNVYFPTDYNNVGKDGFDAENLYIECMLKYGGMYWNGTIWTSVKVPFRVYLDDEGNTEHLNGKYWRIKSNITYDMGIEATEGLAIALPYNIVATEAPEFGIYQPRYRITNHINPEKLPYTGFWLKDFNLELQLKNNNPYADNNEMDTDTKYENVINKDYVNDFDEVEFKVCTWDNKEPNYSAVIYDDGTNKTYLDKVYNTSTSEYFRMEEQFINKMVRQYSQPPYILNITLEQPINCFTILNTQMIGSVDRKFIVDKQKIDWRFNTNEVELIEVKI